MRFKLTFIVILSFNLTAFSQVRDINLLVQLESKGLEIAASYPGVFSPVIQEWGIYSINQVQLHEFCIKHSSFITYIKSQHVNHKLSRRFKPNDPQYINQWAHPLLGTENVWTKNKGGVNKLGDTLVVAVVDGGVDFRNPDLAKNRWINYQEIPGDNIDNDNNGYIDDIYGWNTYQDNGDILDSLSEKGEHGTPIATIIAGNGNNDTGIAGITWNTKIMSVVGGGFEADALKAYNYVLKQKKIWISSSKTKGANIIATNTSWGIDNKFMKDAPLWCAMYDSLGKYGILNISAVANRNIDIDVVGDLPTSCISQYLITVTATNKSDGLYAGSAYGKKSVDIGAPGQSIYVGSSYSDYFHSKQWFHAESGTSFACPQVIGAATMLFSTACDSFNTLYANEPDTALRILKRIILASGKELAGLKNRTLSGKRLDIYEATKRLDAWCNGTSLSPPFYNHKSYEIYPNPIQDHLIIKTNLSEKFIVSIKNILGKSLYSNSHLNSANINLQNFPSGIYFISIKNKNTLSSYKIIKE